MAAEQASSRETSKLEKKSKSKWFSATFSRASGHSDNRSGSSNSSAGLFAISNNLYSSTLKPGTNTTSINPGDEDEDEEMSGNISNQYLAKYDTEFYKEESCKQNTDSLTSEQYASNNVLHDSTLYANRLLESTNKSKISA